MQELRELIEMFCEVSPEYTLHPDYSGRGMFGRTCIGISCDNPYEILVDLTEYLAVFDVCGVRASLGTVCVDDMGLGSIVYFPELSEKE